MEPLSALGIAAAAVQFVDFATSVLSKSREIYKSSSGQTERHSLLTRVTRDVTSLANQVEEKAAGLREGAPLGSAEAIFVDTCMQCKDIAKELANILETLCAKPPPTFNRISARASLAAGIRGILSEGRIKDLTSNLERIQQQMQMAALVCLWEKARQNDETTLQVSQRLVDKVATLDHLDTTVKDTATHLRDAARPRGGQRQIFGWRQRRQVLTEAFLSTKDTRALPPRQDLPLDVQSSHATHLLILDGLSFSTVDDRQSAIPKAYAETFEWLFKPQPENNQSSPWTSFPTWLESDTQEIYWITGKPGAGKSTLMKFLTADPRLKQHLAAWSGPDEVLVASFYSWNAGTALQKSHVGLMRTLLRQCLEQKPDLTPQVCQKRWACFEVLGLVEGDYIPEWQWDELVDCFNTLVSQAENGSRIVLFIDGLDEFEEDHTKLVDLLKDLSRWKGVKICVSSRPWNVFNDAFRANPSLMVQDLTKNDIEHYVRDHFEDLPAFADLRGGHPDAAARLLQDIASRADGVFLWVAVVVRTLTARLIAGDSLTDLFATLNKLPRDVEALFEAIRRQIEPEYLPQSSKYFLLFLELRHRHRNYLTPSAITFLLADEDEESEVHRDFSEMSESAAKRAWMVDTMKRRLHSRTMGLLEISRGGNVDFLHRTVLEWLTVSTNIANIRRDAPVGFNANLELCKAHTTELLNIRLYPAPGSGDDVLASRTDEEFVLLLTLCLEHAALASCRQAADDERVVRMLERVETELPRLLRGKSSAVDKSCADSILARPVSDEDELRVRSLLEHLVTVPDWKTYPRFFIRLAARFGILPYVIVRVDKGFLHEQGVRFDRLLGDVVFGHLTRSRHPPTPIWVELSTNAMPSLRSTRLDLLTHLLQIAPQNRFKRWALRVVKYEAEGLIIKERSSGGWDTEETRFLEHIRDLVKKELSVPMWVWRSFVKGPKRRAMRDTRGLLSMDMDM